MTEFRHNFPSQFLTVTENCDEVPLQIVTDPSQYPSQIVTDSVTNLQKIPQIQPSAQNPSQNSVTKNCKKRCDGPVTIWIVTNVIVTEGFPSQFTLFRHNFLIFPSLFLSQFAVFSVVCANLRINRLSIYVFVVHCRVAMPIPYGPLMHHLNIPKQKEYISDRLG